MNKLLVNPPIGGPVLIEVGQGGGYYDPSRVLWKDSDGPMPDNLRAALAAADKQRAQSEVWALIKAKRDNLSDVGGYLVTVGGVSKWFHSDGKSKTQQLGLLIAGANVPAVQWKTMDGTFVTMSQAWAGAIFAAAAAQDIAIFAAAEAHKSAMEAAANPAAYDFSGGWPAVYGDE